MTDIVYLSPEDLEKKFGIPKWFRAYSFKGEWKNFTEKTIARPIIHGGLIEKGYFRDGDTCFCELTLSVSRFRQTVRSGTMVRYLEIERGAVGEILLKYAKSDLRRINRQAAAGISPNPNDIETVRLELLSAFTGTPYGNLLSGLVKSNDNQKVLDAFGEIAKAMERDRKKLSGLLSVTRFKLSETKIVDEFASLVLIDRLKKVLNAKIPCDDWIRKLEDGVVARKEELPEYIDAEPDESAESMMKKLIEKAKTLLRQ